MAQAAAERKTAGLVPIHLAVFLFGFAGLFAKWLPLPPTVIVLGRTVFAGLALGLWLRIRPAKGPAATVGRKSLAAFGLLGLVLAVHWVTFFQAIRVSTVAVGLLAYSTFPVFITFMEPVFFKEALRTVDLLTAALVTLGLVLVVPRFDLSDHILQGALWGSLSGLTFAVLALLNRHFVRSTSPLVIAFWQNTAAAVVLAPVALTGFNIGRLSAGQWGGLAVLGVGCTALAHALFIRGLASVRAQLAGVIAALEPVYGILLALILLGERPALRTLAGGLLILGATLLATRRRQPS